MTKSKRLAAVAGSLVALSMVASEVAAQGRVGPPNAAAQRIALLDINFVFKNHTRFKQLTEDMKADMQRAQVAMDKERDTIRKLAEQLKGLKTGTAQYKQLEQETAMRTADLSVQVQLQRKEFLLREAKIYHTVYKEVQQEVNQYAYSQGITLVIRFNGEPVQEENPEDVLRKINGDIVWYARELDITPTILKNLNQRAITTDSRSSVPYRQAVPR